VTRITIELPDDVAARVAEAAAEAGVAPEELAGQVIASSFPSPRRLGFIGMGRSGRGDLSERVKELRREVAEEKLADERRSAEG